MFLFLTFSYPHNKDYDLITLGHMPQEGPVLKGVDQTWMYSAPESVIK